MGLWSLLTGWQNKAQAASTAGRKAKQDRDDQRSRRCRFEEMEDRRLMDADPLKLGAVYIEADSGSDLHGDHFEVMFEGGAPSSELTQLVIEGDHNAPGLSVGDMIFDTVKGGLGADEAFPLQVISSAGIDNVTWRLDDGGTRLIFEFQGFHAGDKLVFTVDVDEVQEFDPTQTNLQTINEGIDPIASGVEFQGSQLTGTFKAPRYFDATGSREFRNLYDPLFAGTQLLISQGNAGGLPHDDHLGKRDRSTGAMLPLTQQPLPATISGYVYHDADDDGVFDAGEASIPGTTVVLLDAGGTQIGQTTTDNTGFYKFTGLSAGTYRIHEIQPASWLDGKDAAGTINGLVVGIAQNDRISGITIQNGDEGVHYDFGELLPGSIRGRVWVDPDEDCFYDSGEQLLSGVKIDLLDAAGNVIRTTTTNELGQYEFTDLPPGIYAVREHQPVGYLHGEQMAGSHGGNDTSADLITSIPIGSGQHLTDYDFCEILPASIEGRVWVDVIPNCLVDPGEPSIAGVTIQLFDADGKLVATTKTNAQGQYKFDNLKPGTYTVKELQPAGYFDSEDMVGSHGGDNSQNDLLQNAVLKSGDKAINYDFCETPPAKLSGFVFRDGPPIMTPDGQVPANLYQLRDGKLTSDDLRLKGIVLELRHTLTGDPVMGHETLPGTNPPGPLRAVTNSDGYYEFTGLPAGNYSVFEVHPEGFIDSQDTPGSTNGLAVNLGTFVSPLLVQRFAMQGVSFKFDAILQIPLAAGQSSVLNNFSEVQVQQIIIPPPPPETPPPPPRFPQPFVAPPVFVAPPDVFIVPPKPYIVTGGGGSFTWHLSVVDAGLPRMAMRSTRVADLVMRPAFHVDQTEWQPDRLRHGMWFLDVKEEASGRGHLFGIREAIPVSGDWNGDGKSEIGLFYKGEWFLDLNGNGQWDADDLWAKLGSDADKPVTGDWDGDGKDDIGIFGPEWAGDPRHIEHEPGLPDPHNVRLKRPKNPPPNPDQATDGERLLRLTAVGKERADLIDHVFRFGGPTDIPIAGDWNGDGIRSIGVFRNGKWHFDMDGDGRWSEGDLVAHFGEPGDIAVVGDFNGDGIEEIGIFRNGQWIIDTNGNRQIDAADQRFELGAAGDQPVVGDWDGDGIDEPAVYREESNQPKE